MIDCPSNNSYLVTQTKLCWAYSGNGAPDILPSAFSISFLLVTTSLPHAFLLLPSFNTDLFHESLSWAVILEFSNPLLILPDSPAMSLVSQRPFPVNTQVWIGSQMIFVSERFIAGFFFPFLYFPSFLWIGYTFYNLKLILGTSLVAQWLRICLPMQGTQVCTLVQENPTGRGATKPVRHNYWANALEPASHNYWAHAPQLLKPAHPRALASQEKPPHWEASAPQRRVAPARHI